MICVNYFSSPINDKQFAHALNWEIYYAFYDDVPVSTCHKALVNK